MTFVVYNYENTVVVSSFNKGQVIANLCIGISTQ